MALFEQTFGEDCWWPDAIEQAVAVGLNVGWAVKELGLIRPCSDGGEAG